MSTKLDTVEKYFTGTVTIPLSSRYAMGADTATTWLPSDYVLVGGKVDTTEVVDYALSRLLEGKVPDDSSDATRLYHTYTELDLSSELDGWLSSADPYFEDNSITPATGSTLGYVVDKRSDLATLWPETQEELDSTTITLLKNDTPLTADVDYIVDLHGLWFITDSYDSLPLDLFVGDPDVYTVSLTRSASEEGQLNGVEAVDETLVNPVVGTTDLALDVLNTGADQCDATPKVINLYSNQTSTVILKPYDANGRVIDLGQTVYIPIFTLKTSRSATSLAGRYTCSRRTTEPSGTPPTYTRLNEFEVELTVDTPGMYVAQLMLFDSTGAKLLFVTDYYAAVAPSGAYGGTVTIQELRFHLADACAQKNELIDAFEYTDADIVNAVHNCVEFFNGVMGSTTLSFTTSNFPVDGRYFLKQGVAAQLLRTRALLLARNTLAYNAGGVSLDDQNKSGVYMQLATAMNQDWQTYVGRKHQRVCMSRSFMVLN